jgi:hypothetical protein
MDAKPKGLRAFCRCCRKVRVDVLSRFTTHRTTMNLGATLKSHKLTDGVLPFAPRWPFADRSTASLSAAAILTARYPEKCGILSHLVRAYRGDETPTMTSGIRIEAHFDATAIPAELADRLLELGFEPDGFARFVPAHFTDHYTLKFKIAAANSARARALRVDVEERFATLSAELAARWSNVEAYVELEMYSEATRRRWLNSALRSDWISGLPYPAGALSSVVPPRDAEEARSLGIPTTLVKRADLHVKISKSMPAADRDTLIERLRAIGFYNVLTWAGNEVCTAQFAKGSDARRCFKAFNGYFTRHGGCSELTMESVPSVWRSRHRIAGTLRLATLPPLVLSVQHP